MFLFYINTYRYFKTDLAAEWSTGQHSRYSTESITAIIQHQGSVRPRILRLVNINNQR